MGGNRKVRGGKCDAGREVWKWGVVGMTQGGGDDTDVISIFFPAHAHRGFQGRADRGGGQWWEERMEV